MKPAIFGILCFMAMNCFPAFAANEPQTIDPKLDQALLARFPGLWVPGTPVPDVFNILIIGQDDSQAGSRGGRAQLGSRSDIIMLLSLNRITKRHTILSVYRDHPPTAGCEARIGQAPDGKINGVYSIRGRQGFIPCIEGMLEEMAANLPATLQKDVFDRSNKIKVHAFFEGTRSQTISPLGKDIAAVVSNNKTAFLSTYGVLQTTAALGVILGNKVFGKGGPSYLLGSSLSEEEARRMVDPKYLTVELKERKVYPAGGYQRAFNFATVTSTILGWAGYGANQWKAQNYDFLSKFFGAVIDKNMSRSVGFETLEKQVFIRNGEHLLAQTCFKGGHSPIRIVQWGESANIFSVYLGGKMVLSSQATMLKGLTYVDILPPPSDCN